VYGGVAGFRDWIMQTALAAAEAGSYEPPFWALSGTSDRPPGVEGDPCGSGAVCGGGTVCYYESDPVDAFCTRTCAVRSDCSEQTACVSGFDVPGGGLCLARLGTADPEPRKRPRGGSCALDPGARYSSILTMALALVGCCLLVRRRGSAASCAISPQRHMANRR
jgi:hypothetical protein